MSVQAGDSNVETGANSFNQNTTTTSSNSQTTVDNQSTTNNAVSFSIDTGHNVVSQNTSVGPVSSGSVNFSFGSATVANGGTPSVSSLSTSTGSAAPAVSASNANTATGANSTNTNSQYSTSSHVLSISNSATTNNSASGTITTGGNRVTGNTTVGSVSSGSVNVSVNFNTTANTPAPVATPVPTPTPTPIVATPAPVDTGIQTFLGKGANELSLPSLPAVTLASATTPAFTGKGGYFAAGATGFPLEVIMFASISLLAVMVSPAHSLRQRIMAKVSPVVRKGL